MSPSTSSVCLWKQSSNMHETSKRRSTDILKLVGKGETSNRAASVGLRN